MSLVWTCKCTYRTWLHNEWCGACGSPKPPPVPDTKYPVKVVK